jgi:rhamnogalacturonyl hydrolase YesR
MENELNQKALMLVDESLRGLKGYPRYGFGGTVKRCLQRVIGRKIPPRDLINWQTGLLANGLAAFYQNSLYTETSLTIKKALVKYFKRFISSKQRIHYLDNATAGVALIDMHKVTGDSRFKDVLDHLVVYLKEHAVDEEGSLPYRPRQGSMDIYADGIGMICPFLCKYGVTYDDPGSISLAVTQLVNFLENGMDSRSGLPYHGYHVNSSLRKGIIGWGRACGWLLIGLIESLIHLDPEAPDYDTIKQGFRHLVDKVESYQHEDGMFSWQLTAMEGPIDTSATAMILYAIARGIEHEFLIGLHRTRMLRGRDALINAIEDGKLYDCLDESGGFGIYPQRYDSFPWSVGPALSLLSVNLKELPE